MLDEFMLTLNTEIDDGSIEEVCLLHLFKLHLPACVYLHATYICRNIEFVHEITLKTFVVYCSKFMY